MPVRQGIPDFFGTETPSSRHNRARRVTTKSVIPACRHPGESLLQRAMHIHPTVAEFLSMIPSDITPLPEAAAQGPVAN